jgi:hypothetical protein
VIHTEKRQMTLFVEVVKECDRCHKKYDIDVESFETQEFHHINFTGGFASVFGDGVHVECDLCQKCLKELIDDICRVY